MQSQDDYHALSYFNVCYKNLWQDSVNMNWNVCALYGTLWEPKILIQMLWARPSISGSCCCIKIVIYYQQSICWWFSWFSSAACLTVLLPLQGENMAVNHPRNFKEPLCSNSYDIIFRYSCSVLISNTLIFTELCRAVVGTQMYCIMWTARLRQVIPGCQTSRTCCSKVSCWLILNQFRGGPVGF